MTARRGRGRPALFTEAAQAVYLKARAAGATQAEAGVAAGVAVRTVHDAYKRVEGFREADRHAVAAVRTARAGDPDRHGEGCYNRGCRQAACRAKASEARAARRARERRNSARAQEEGAPVVPLQQPSPTARSRKVLPPLAKAS
jgi:hypothetical protein